MRWILTVACLLVAPTVHAQVVQGTVENTPRACQNGVDDDGDGLVDCDDEGCSRLIFCVGYRPSEDTLERCTNDVDDDGDGLADCADSGCAAIEPCASGVSERRGLGTEGIYEPRVVEERPDARYVTIEDPRAYPQAYVRQPMTYLSGMLVPALGLSARDLPFLGRSAVHAGAGVSYGLLDAWQVTLVPLALRFAPTVEIEDPAISTTLRFFAEDFIELGLYANLAVPVASRLESEPLPLAHLLARSRASDVAQLDLALLVRLHVADVVRIDLAAPIATLVFGQPEVRADLVFPLSLSVQLSPYVYLGAESGAILPGPSYDAPKIPIGFFVGTTIPGWRRGPAFDGRVRVAWPTFWDASRRGDEVRGDGWQITVDLRVFSYLLP